MDVDVLDHPTCRLPRRPDGIEGSDFTQLVAALRELVAAPNWVALTLCEVNPDHGESDGSTLRRLNEGLADAISEAFTPSSRQRTITGQGRPGRPSAGTAEVAAPRQARDSDPTSSGWIEHLGSAERSQLVIGPRWVDRHGVEGWVHEELVRQAQQGDAEAFDALARMVGDRCLGIAVRILRDLNLAEDAVQAALITAWTELRTLRDPSRFEPWLHRILTNACYAEARRRTRWSEGMRILPVAGTYGPDEYLTVDDRDLLERAFRRLTLEQRAVLVFHHYLGLSISEVAIRTELPVGTAKSRLHHATRALKASIEADARATAPSQERLA